MKDIGRNVDKNILTVVNICFQLPTAVKSNKTALTQPFLKLGSRIVDIKQM